MKINENITLPKNDDVIKENETVSLNKNEDVSTDKYYRRSRVKKVKNDGDIE